MERLKSLREWKEILETERRGYFTEETEILYVEKLEYLRGERQKCWMGRGYRISYGRDGII